MLPCWAGTLASGDSMLFIEDFFEPVSKTPESSHYGEYQSGAYQPVQGAYKNSGNFSVPTVPAAAKGPPRQYGSDMVVHEKGLGYGGEDQRGVEYASLADRVLSYKVVIAGKMTRGSSFEALDTPSAKRRDVQEYGGSNIGN